MHVFVEHDKAFSAGVDAPFARGSVGAYARFQMADLEG